MNSPTIALKSGSVPPTSAAAEAKRKRFETYELADEKVQAAKAVYEAALAERSDAVKEIYEYHGRGPFNFGSPNGVVIVIRKNNTTGKDTYFFRDRAKKELEDI